MAATVGGVSCTYVQGSQRGFVQRVLTWFVPGVDGYFALKLGFNDSSFAFRCIQYDSLTNLQTWKNTLEALIGTVVSVTDDQGTTYSSLLVTDVRGSPRWRTPAINSGVAGVTTRGELSVSGVVVS